MIDEKYSRVDTCLPTGWWWPRWHTISANTDINTIEIEWGGKEKCWGGEVSYLCTSRPKRARQLTLREQLEQYISLDIGEIDSVFVFWSSHEDSLPALAKLARRYLYIPATSAPVERIFSHGGIVMRPHRSSLGEETLSDILLIKCNMDLLV